MKKKMKRANYVTKSLIAKFSNSLGTEMFGTNKIVSRTNASSLALSANALISFDICDIYRTDETIYHPYVNHKTCQRISHSVENKKWHCVRLKNACKSIRVHNSQ